MLPPSTPIPSRKPPTLPVPGNLRANWHFPIFPPVSRVPKKAGFNVGGPGRAGFSGGGPRKGVSRYTDIQLISSDGLRRQRQFTRPSSERPQQRPDGRLCSWSGTDAVRGSMPCRSRMITASLWQHHSRCRRPGPTGSSRPGYEAGCHLPRRVGGLCGTYDGR